MLSDIPTITHHALLRAQERLGCDHVVFYGWVKATYQDWLPVNAAWLSDRGVRVSAHGSRWYYVCPWTPRLNLAFCVSEDRAVVTVIPFEAEQPGDRTPLRRAARRLFEQVSADEFIKWRLGKKIRGELVDAGLEAFASGERDAEWLSLFVAGTTEHRKNLLGLQERRLTDFERQFITPAAEAVKAT